MPKGITTIQSYVYPLLIALFLPVFLGLFNPAGVADLLYWLVVIIAVTTPPFILYRIVSEWRSGENGLVSALLKYIRPLPMGLVYRTDLKIRQRPDATICLILANAVIYFLVPTDLVKHFAFFPAGDPGIARILVSVFTSTFLHGSIYHLLINMVFLWVFGSVLEARIKTGRFLLVYFFSIAASNLMFFCLLFFHLGFADISSGLTQFHSIGASGAVAGVMGAFAVRCFFARLSVTLPFLFLPFLSVAFRVQAAVLIALFFAADIAGSVHQF
ncbi:MAG: rhomboid family intramembrane serine protease [Desulfobacteraceae bacterium]|nr:rhomboid family intramembrane serine protease [Desulfobacteraceae bacterium]